MKPNGTWKCVFAMAAFTLASTAVASSPIGASGASSPSSGSPTVIERGGVVTAYDADTKVLAVDGVSYQLSSGISVVHGDRTAVGSAEGQLRKGARVRFNTTGYPHQNRERVIELWIVPDASLQRKR